MTDFSRARRTMVDNQLRTSGITDWRILDAMNRVPRETFVPESQIDFAYSENAIPLWEGRAMPSPAAFARLVQLAQITPRDVVLDVGCGNGYSSAVLARLAESVVGLEIDEAQADGANARFEALEIGNAAAVYGPLAAGANRNAPYDVIVLEGAVDAVPQALFDQLRDGGRLAAVIGVGNAAVAHLYIRTGQDVAATPSFNLNIPQLGVFAPHPEFIF